MGQIISDNNCFTINKHLVGQTTTTSHYQTRLVYGWCMGIWCQYQTIRWWEKQNSLLPMKPWERLRRDFIRGLEVWDSTPPWSNPISVLLSSCNTQGVETLETIRVTIAAISQVKFQQTHFWDNTHLVGGIPTPLKNVSQLGWLFPIYGKTKHVPTTNQILITINHY